MWQLPEARWHYVLSKRPHPGTSSSPLLELKIVLTDDPLQLWCTLQPVGHLAEKRGTSTMALLMYDAATSLSVLNKLFWPWKVMIMPNMPKFIHCPPTIFYLQYTDKMISFAFVVNGKKEMSREPLEHQLPKKKMLQPNFLQRKVGAVRECWKSAWSIVKYATICYVIYTKYLYRNLRVYI